MTKKDNLWQKLLDEEKQRLSTYSADKLIAIESGKTRIIKNGNTTIEYVIWHQVHSEDVDYSSTDKANTLSAQLDRKFDVRRPQRVTHSFVLQATRNILFGFYTNYLAGFSLDESGKVAPISDDVLYSYD